MKGALIIFLLLFFSSCKEQGRFCFYSPDKSQCISIITTGNIRYIIDGYHAVIPDTNYVKISLEDIDRHVGDQLVGCWKKNGLQWEMMMDEVAILENKLDTTKFIFRDKFPVDSMQIPTLKGYSTNLPNCFSLEFVYNDLIDASGAIAK